MKSPDWKRISKMRRDSIHRSSRRDGEVRRRWMKVKDLHLEVGLIPASSCPSSWRRKSGTSTDVDSSERMMTRAAQQQLRRMGAKGRVRLLLPVPPPVDDEVTDDGE